MKINDDSDRWRRILVSNNYLTRLLATFYSLLFHQQCGRNVEEKKKINHKLNVWENSTKYLKPVCGELHMEGKLTKHRRQKVFVLPLGEWNTSTRFQIPTNTCLYHQCRLKHNSHFLSYYSQRRNYKRKICWSMN